MTFVAVEKVPEKKCAKAGTMTEFKPMKARIDEFMKMGIKCARVEFSPNEYRSVESAHSAFAKLVRYYAYPITVNKRGDEVYLTRRDI
jgi:hypothetical protein